MYATLKQKLISNEAKIGIIGQGYVGLPLAVEFAKAGLSVTGFEVDPAKVKSINAGISYIEDVPSETVKGLVAKKKLSATSDFKRLKAMDAVIICVPTPLRKSKDPDVSYIISAADQVVANLRRGQIIVLESTTYPGTTSELVLPMLEKSGLICGRDFFLAFSPERVDPGNKLYNIHNTPKVVGGIGEPASRIAAELYGKVTAKVHLVSSTEAAEMVKLLENTFRAVNIALVNEVALMCDRLNLDVWEIIEAAASKPFGFIPFYPGPGIGGHCIPLDPHYLSWKLKTLNFYSRFIELAGEMNSKMPEVLVQKVVDALNDKCIAIRNAKVLVVGVAYKKDVGDLRESPALDVVSLLLKRRAKLEYYDPYVEEMRLDGVCLRSIKDLKSVGRYDCVVIVTNHTVIDYAAIVKKAKLVIDSRNATRGIKSNKVVKL